MKKYTSILISTLLTSYLMAGCSTAPANSASNLPLTTSEAGSSKLGILTPTTLQLESDLDVSVSSNPTVYMTTDISSEGLVHIYEALGRKADGEKVAVKISTGEPGGHNFLNSEMIRELVLEVNGLTYGQLNVKTCKIK